MRINIFVNDMYIFNSFWTFLIYDFHFAFLFKFAMNFIVMKIISKYYFIGL